MRKGDWIQTYSGRIFWPFDPDPNDICLEDIAHSLSQICRFNGHTKFFYSVAEHSVYVSEFAFPFDENSRLLGLFHDAAEAYICDLPRPIKPFIPEYELIEKKILQTILDRFDISWSGYSEVKKADEAILADEKKWVMRACSKKWNLSYPPIGIKIEGWNPEKAEKRFIQRYKEIVGE